MAQITLQNLAHSYHAQPDKATPTFALKEMDHVWEDGGAYALLGSSGCGKTTLLEHHLGPGAPVSRAGCCLATHDVTDADTAARNIAQVFQFPVVYDTMTVRDNLAFPAAQPGHGCGLYRRPRATRSPR